MFDSLDRDFGSDDEVCVSDGGFRSLLHPQTEALTQMKRIRLRLSRQKVARRLAGLVRGLNVATVAKRLQGGGVEQQSAAPGPGLPQTSYTPISRDSFGTAIQK
jgi:hypothetical protein